MERFVSNPLEIPRDEDEEIEFSRADLVFYDVDHSGPSFEARVFLNNPDASAGTPCDDEQGYAGSFYVFGHGGCYGEEGHCEPDGRTRDAFDVRPPHPLTGYTKTVIVTEALKRVTTPEVVVTVVAVMPDEDEAVATDALSFDTVRLLTYD
jgi:hypothetical protein